MVRANTKRKGLAEIIGGLFILAFLVTVMGLSMVAFGAFQTYQSSLNQKAAYLDQKHSEQLDYRSVMFLPSANLSIVLENHGSTPIHIVSLWLVGAAGPTHFDETLAGPLHIDAWIGPARTAVVYAPFQWSPGQYSIELVTEKGNIFTDVVNAT